MAIPTFGKAFERTNTAPSATRNTDNSPPPVPAKSRLLSAENASELTFGGVRNNVRSNVPVAMSHRYSLWAEPPTARTLPFGETATLFRTRSQLGFSRKKARTCLPVVRSHRRAVPSQ